MKDSVKKESVRETITKDQMEQILEQASRIRYGSISLIIQNGVLVQIDSTEKVRVR